jgi:hypothetical protein
MDRSQNSGVRTQEAGDSSQEKWGNGALECWTAPLRTC